MSPSTLPEWAQQAHDGEYQVGDRIFAIGGFDGAATFDIVESRRATGSGEWRTVASMSTPRANFAAAALDGRIYVVGGVGEREHLLAIVEMARPRPRRSSMYVAGGTLNFNSATASMMVFDPRENEWRSAAPMGTARVQLRLVASGRYLYAISGRDNSPSPSTVERYDPATDSWHTLSPLRQARVAPGVVATTIGNRPVLAIGGGTNDSGTIRTLRDVDALSLGGPPHLG